MSGLFNYDLLFVSYVLLYIQDIVHAYNVLVYVPNHLYCSVGFSPKVLGIYQSDTGMAGTAFLIHSRQKGYVWILYCIFLIFTLITGANVSDIIFTISLHVHSLRELVNVGMVPTCLSALE